jgi:glycosyltransferase involved in cell wall biosynthesis
MNREGNLMVAKPTEMPKLGILDYHPIQYLAPLYQLLTLRGKVDIDVLFLSDNGYRPAIDPGFGVDVAWNIDLLSGYKHRFLTRAGSRNTVSRLITLRRWILHHDVVVIYGYVKPLMLLAMAICQSHGVPYLLRGDSLPDGASTGIRRGVRNFVAGTAVSRSAGCLAIGQMNEAFCRRFGAREITLAPYSVDDERFARPPECGRTELLERWGLRTDKPIILFCGKLIPRKRPLDLTAALNRLPHDVITIFVGDGPLAETVRTSLRPDRGVVTGFVNQSELPSYYHAGDILVLPSEAEPWGLVVNEAMAAGVLPVVSDRVGCAPDLVRGIGEVYPCGDVSNLCAALSRAVTQIQDAETRRRVQRYLTRCSLERTATGFEEAVSKVGTRTHCRTSKS